MQNSLNCQSIEVFCAVKGEQRWTIDRKERKYSVQLKETFYAQNTCMHTENILEILFWHFNDYEQYLVTRIIYLS